MWGGSLLHSDSGGYSLLNRALSFQIRAFSFESGRDPQNQPNLPVADLEKQAQISFKGVYAQWEGTDSPSSTNQATGGAL